MTADRAAGQASLELLGGTVAALFAGALGLQVLGAGYAAVMADHAAEAAALAVANGAPPREAALAALPGWPSGALRVRHAGGHVTVTLVPPSPLPFLRGRLEIDSRASVRAPEPSP